MLTLLWPALLFLPATVEGARFALARAARGPQAPTRSRAARVTTIAELAERARRFETAT